MYFVMKWDVQHCNGGLGRFFKQPDALPDRAPPKTTFDSFVMFYQWFLFEFFLVCGALPGSAGCFKKATETPNAGHRLWLKKNP
jgi:hypothetical protein